METGPETLRTSTRAPALIAVAEDDDDFRELVCELLRAAGHQVVELEDGFELLDYVDFVKSRELMAMVPDLLITDLRMPGATGLDVVGRGRQLGLACPVLMLTAFPSDELRRRATEVGGVQVLSKPIEAGPLLSAVHAALKARR